MTWRFWWGGPDWSDPFGNGKLVILYTERDGSRRYVLPLQVTGLPEGGVIPTPTIQFQGDREQFQQALMDSLWEQGVRPSEHKITNVATERHLADMRAIVAKQLKTELP